MNQMLEKQGVYVVKSFSISLHSDLDEFYFDKYIKDGDSIYVLIQLSTHYWRA